MNPQATSLSGSDPRRKLAAILFVDMVGYTALMEESEAVALGLVEELRGIAGAAIQSRSGEVVKTIGDGIFAAFGSAVEAVRAALALQRDLAARNQRQGKTQSLSVRIGIHLGDLLQEGDDLFGSGVNVASRLEPLAPPGGILISGEIHQQVRNQGGLSFKDLGERRLHNIQEPVRVYAVEYAAEEIVPTSAESPAGPRAIAVLPFQNMSPDPENEYFSDGVTEEIITRLSKIRQLRVVSRSATFQYKGKSIDPREAGRTLGADSVLEGSVRKHGNRLRITAQLIDAQDGYHLWSDQYDRDLDDVFAIQSEIAQRVAEALQVELLSREKQEMERVATENLEAYTLYLKGRFYWNKRTAADLRTAIDYFKQAIELEPGFALAHSGLADSHLLLDRYGGAAPSQSSARAKVAATRAVQLDPNLAEARASLGLATAYADWDWSRSTSELRHAIQLNPNYPTAHQWLAWLLAALGRHEEAVSETRRALELDPLSPFINAGLGTIFYFVRRYGSAEEQLRRALELFPDFVAAHQWLGRVYGQADRHEEAIAEHEKAVELLGEDPESLASLAHAHGVAGARHEARRILDELATLSERRYVSPFWAALIHTGLGETDEALRWLEKAFDDHTEWVIFLGVEPMFDGLRGDPRFQALLSRLGLPE